VFSDAPVFYRLGILVLIQARAVRFRSGVPAFKARRKHMSSYIQAIVPFISKIVDDEVWYEGERRRCPVCREDPIVTARIADIIMKEAPKIREQLGFVSGATVPKTS
jgi:hypothetical protein